MILIIKKYKSIYLVDEGLVSISEVTYQLFMTRPYMHALSLFLHKPLFSPLYIDMCMLKAKLFLPCLSALVVCCCANTFTVIFYLLP